jgi:hypothetical protein
MSPAGGQIVGVKRATVGCLLVGLLAVGGVSCGPSGPTLHPVRGSVHFDGQPAEGATVVLDPVGGGGDLSKPSGTVSADGTFTVTTHPHGSGAVAGEYAVLVTWYPPDARSVDNPKNKLPAKYSDPAKTPVPKVTVPAGGTEIPPLKLTAK